LKGNKITRDEAIKAKCYECNGAYADGTGDCNIESCPLHLYMPYAVSEPAQAVWENENEEQ